MTNSLGTPTIGERQAIAEREARQVCVDYRLSPESYERSGGKHPLQSYIEGAILRAFAALLPPTTNAPVDDLREAIARIIDPTAWKLDCDGYFVEQVHSDEALAKADAALSLTKTATNADMRGAWDWLAENRRLEVRHYAPVYGDDDDQGVEWRVTEVSGSINDREWTTVGRGATPLEAVLAARTVLQGDQS